MTIWPISQNFTLLGLKKDAINNYSDVKKKKKGLDQTGSVRELVSITIEELDLILKHLLINKI